MEPNHTRQETNGTDDEGRTNLNRGPDSPPGPNTDSDKSAVHSRATEEITKNINSKVPAPKCKPGMVPFMENFKKKVIYFCDDFLANIQIEGVDPFDELSSFSGATMKRLYQLHSFIDGYS
jgi:hypothetical protein